MSKHAIHTCNCGVHVPFEHWENHLKGTKHKVRIARMRKGIAPLPEKKKKGKSM